MKVNKNTKIIGQNVVLVPYKECHVEKYYKWMGSEELLKLTGSEPLTLEQEYNNQKSWSTDEGKCTFIILDKIEYETSKDEIGSMVGDTNIFILEKDDNHAIGEIEIMIAEESARGKKFGWEAVILMMLYGIQHIGIKCYHAKILVTNIMSIKMFEKLGFATISTSDVFKEVTMEKLVTSDWVTWLQMKYKFQIIQI